MCDGRCIRPKLFIEEVDEKPACVIVCICLPQRDGIQPFLYVCQRDDHKAGRDGLADKIGQ